MKIIDIPTLKFPEAFGVSAAPGDINPIPTAYAGSGLASFDLGFPHETLIPEGAGGVPPRGQDFNGLFNQITAWLLWNNNAGGPIGYDSAFSGVIGGYPKGAVLASATVGSWWLCIADDNTSDPDTGGSNWVGYTPINLTATTSGINTMTATLVPAPSGLPFLIGRPIFLTKGTGTNTAAVTLNVNSAGAKAVVHPDGSAIGAGELPLSGYFTVIWTGTAFQLQSQSVFGGITAAQLQAQAGNYAVDTGTANTYVCAFTPAIGAHTNGLPIRVKILHANTGASTVNPGPGVKNIINPDGSALTKGQLPAGAIAELKYDGVAYQLAYMVPPLAAIQAQGSNFAVDSGAANAYACTLNPPIAIHTLGMPIRLMIAHNNTAASTFNPGPGAQPITDYDGNDLAPGMLVAGMIAELIWTNTSYQLMNPATSSPSGVLTFPGGRILQWVTGVSDPATPHEPSQVIDFPIPFPNVCEMAFVSMDIGTPSPDVDVWYQTASWDQMSVTVQRQFPGTGTVLSATVPKIWAVGR